MWFKKKKKGNDCLYNRRWWPQILFHLELGAFEFKLFTKYLIH